MTWALIGKPKFTAVVQQRASGVGLDEINRDHREIMITVGRDAEDLSFKVGQGTVNERRTVRRLRPPHIGELVNPTRGEDSSHLDLTGRQHVKSHRVRAPNLQPRRARALGREGDEYRVKREGAEGLTRETCRSFLRQCADDHDAGHVVTDHLFVVRYVERTHPDDTTARTYELVARKLDNATTSLYEAVRDKSIHDVVIPRLIKTGQR